MNKLKYRKAWRFPEPVQQFLASRLFGNSLHVCNGSSSLGSVRLDKFSSDTDIRGDMCRLPFKDNSFDSVLSDPPWFMDNRIKGQLVKEIRRVLRPGGRCVFNAPWSPKQPGMRVDSISIPERQLMTFHHVAPVYELTKTRGQLL